MQFAATVGEADVARFATATHALGDVGTVAKTSELGVVASAAIRQRTELAREWGADSGDNRQEHKYE